MDTADAIRTMEPPEGCSWREDAAQAGRVVVWLGLVHVLLANTAPASSEAGPGATCGPSCSHRQGRSQCAGTREKIYGLLEAVKCHRRTNGTSLDDAAIAVLRQLPDADDIIRNGKELARAVLKVFAEGLSD